MRKDEEENGLEKLCEDNGNNRKGSIIVRTRLYEDDERHNVKDKQMLLSYNQETGSVIIY